MYMTDAVLQMAIQSTCQTRESVQGTGEAGQTNGETAASFQDLLEQQRQELTQTQGEKPGREESEQVQEDGRPQKDQTQPTGMETVLWGWMVPNTGLVETDQKTNGLIRDLSGVLKVQINPVGMQKGLHPGPVLHRPVEPISLEPMQAQQPEQTTAQSTQTMQVATGLAKDSGLDAVAPETANQMLLTDQQSDGSQEFSGVPTGQEDGKSLEGVTVQGWQTPLFGELEAAPVRVGDAPVDMTAPTQEVEANLAQTIHKGVEEGSEYLEIKLKPDHLGTVVAEFTRTPEGALHVVLHAESEQTAKLLGDHASALGLLLQDSSNGQVRIEVAQPQQHQEAWQQFNQNGGQQQSQQQPQRHAPEPETEAFLQQLRLGLVQMEEE